MKQIKWIAVALLLTASILIWNSSRKKTTDSSERSDATATGLKYGHGHAASSSSVATQPTNGNPTASSVNPAALEAPSREVILEKIHDAAVAYHPDSVPLIEPFLLHGDPEVRKAAIDGMIMLGERSAVPVMRAAASKAPTPEDTIALLQAAAYIELPSSPLKLRKKKKDDAK